MCGWPVGAAYPATDSEPALVAITAEQDEGIADEEPHEDHTGAQLDALSSMVERQTMTHAVANEEANADTEAAAEELHAEHSSQDEAVVDRESTDKATAEATPELVMAQATAPSAPPASAGAGSDLDPLTAPLEMLEGRPQQQPTTSEPAGDDVDLATSEQLHTPPGAPVLEDVADGLDDSDETEPEAGTDDAKSTNSKTLAVLLVLLVVLALALAGVYTLM